MSMLLLVLALIALDVIALSTPLLIALLVVCAIDEIIEDIMDIVDRRRDQ